jgi:Family of unknown function (DUF6544)
MTLLFIIVLVVHGLIHLLGVVKGFRLAELPQLTQPISASFGLVWLAASVLFITSAVSVLVWPRWWWTLGALAVCVSMVAISSSWTDARVGAVANLVILAGVVFGFMVHGPVSMQAAYESDVADRRAPATTARTITEADLEHLPPPVRRYLRTVGVIGHPRVHHFRARMHGRIRSGPDARWMPFTAEQDNFLDGEPARLFYMTASMVGIPFQGFHRYVGRSASMRVKVGGIAPVVNASGVEMTKAETVTLLNDICIMAPAALIDSRIVWAVIDDRTVRATLTNAGHSVRAWLEFNDSGELTNFWSDDRAKASSDGASMTPTRWSTPMSGYRQFGRFRLASRGEARWGEAGKDYAYIELELDEVTYDLSRSAMAR